MPQLSLNEASELCAGTAALMSEAARLQYQGQARQEIDDYDAHFSDDDVPNPVKFAHEIGGMYLLAAGDFVHGMHLMVEPSWNLRFSLPSLARSTCEYSAISWMLSRADWSVEQRLAKTFATIRHDANQAGSVTSLDEAGRDILDRCERWIARQQFCVPRGLAKIVDLQEDMFPGLGRVQYQDLSGLVHGRLMSMLRGALSTRENWPDRDLDYWVEVLIATSRGLAAAVTVASLRGSMPEHLADVWELHGHYSNELGFPRMLGETQ